MVLKVTLSIVIAMLTCISSAKSRDLGKTFKTLPAVTNSLVNLGKMDFAFYFNVHPEDINAFKSDGLLRSDFSLSPKKETFIEPCPCSSLKYVKDSAQNYPSDLLKKILSGNDLFSFKEPDSSPLCCNSHEHFQEHILLEFSPKKKLLFTNSQNAAHSFSFLPYLLDSLQSRPSLPTMPVKPKAVEILFFPKKTGILPMDFNKLKEKKVTDNKKDAIKIVGDKEIKNKFKSGIIVPPLPSSTIKDSFLQKKAKNVSNEIEQAMTTV
ncbi:unnamed protein product, partial [Brenthis ino]